MELSKVSPSKQVLVNQPKEEVEEPASRVWGVYHVRSIENTAIVLAISSPDPMEMNPEVKEEIRGAAFVNGISVQVIDDEYQVVCCDPRIQLTNGRVVNNHFRSRARDRDESMRIENIKEGQVISRPRPSAMAPYAGLMHCVVGDNLSLTQPLTVILNKLAVLSKEGGSETERALVLCESNSRILENTFDSVVSGLREVLTEIEESAKPEKLVFLVESEDAFERLKQSFQTEEPSVQLFEDSSTSVEVIQDQTCLEQQTVADTIAPESAMTTASAEPIAAEVDVSAEPTPIHTKKTKKKKKTAAALTSRQACYVYTEKHYEERIRQFDSARDKLQQFIRFEAFNYETCSEEFGLLCDSLKEEATRLHKEAKGKINDDSYRFFYGVICVYTDCEIASRYYSSNMARIPQDKTLLFLPAGYKLTEGSISLWSLLGLMGDNILTQDVGWKHALLLASGIALIGGTYGDISKLRLRNTDDTGVWKKELIEKFIKIVFDMLNSLRSSGEFKPFSLKRQDVLGWVGNRFLLTDPIASFSRKPSFHLFLRLLTVMIDNVVLDEEGALDSQTIRWKLQVLKPLFEEAIQTLSHAVEGVTSTDEVYQIRLGVKILADEYNKISTAADDPMKQQLNMLLTERLPAKLAQLPSPTKKQTVEIAGQKYVVRHKNQELLGLVKQCIDHHNAMLQQAPGAEKIKLLGICYTKLSEVINDLTLHRILDKQSSMSMLRLMHRLCDEVFSSHQLMRSNRKLEPDFNDIHKAHMECIDDFLELMGFFLKELADADHKQSQILFDFAFDFFRKFLEFDPSGIDFNHLCMFDEIIIHSEHVADKPMYIIKVLKLCENLLSIPVEMDKDLVSKSEDLGANSRKLIKKRGDLILSFMTICHKQLDRKAGYELDELQGMVSITRTLKDQLIRSPELEGYYEIGKLKRMLSEIDNTYQKIQQEKVEEAWGVSLTEKSKKKRGKKK